MPKQKISNTRVTYFSDKLTKKMEQLADYPCTLIEAPMGYGKTTAVRDYLQKSEAYILWQKIYDNSVQGFWFGFCKLFDKLDAQRSHHLIQLGFPNDSVSLQEALRLMKEIKIPSNTILVIDDYHMLNQTEVVNFIKYLVMNEIDHLHLVLTARYIDLPSIEELLLKGYINRITKESFEFMPNDIIKYYGLCGISLKNNVADELYSRSEGWISALYLLMLGYKAKKSFIVTDSIYNLIEDVIYKPFTEDTKDFLLSICIFDSFTAKQAIHMWSNEGAVKILADLTKKNAFVSYDSNTKIYQIHNIFTNYLQDILEQKEDAYKKNLNERAGHWYKNTGDYLSALHYFYAASDFDNLLEIVESRKANSFGYEQKELLIKYFEECPRETKRRHPVALLSYAMSMITFNERDLFQKTCTEITELIQNSSQEKDSINRLMGEFELLISFTCYNDIKEMSKHHQKACKLLREPTIFMDTTGCWTFGSPSVLYMFYRESRKLEETVQEIKTAMPYYYQLTNGHGTGAEHVMAAEWYYNQGDLENAEIEIHIALYLATNARQPNIIICALFLQVRLSLMKGDYTNILDLYEKMKQEILQKEYYVMIHTIDMCIAFVNTCLNQNSNIPEWLAEGDFNSSRLFFPARAFSYIIYGRVLLNKGEYLKLLGVAQQFIGIASVFHNLLTIIYTDIYIAASNERIHRREEAVKVLKQALDIAMPDQVYMPFVENGDYIKPLLEVLYQQGIHREDIARILKLYETYHSVAEQITKKHFTESKPRLTERENEVAQLAAEGFSNKEIGERLFISQNTVKALLKSVFEKIGINSRSLLKLYFNEETKLSS